MAEDILVGHLYGVRALGSDALDRTAYVQYSLRAQTLRAYIQRQERASPSDAGGAVYDDGRSLLVSGPGVVEVVQRERLGPPRPRQEAQYGRRAAAARHAVVRPARVLPVPDATGPAALKVAEQ